MGRMLDLGGLITEEADDAGLTALKTAIGAGKLRLFLDTFVPTRANVVADFVAAVVNATGYADATPTWSANAIDSDGNAVSVSSRNFFETTAASPGKAAGGAWLEDSTGKLIDYWIFTNPVPLAGVGSFAALIVWLRYAGKTTLDVEN